MKPFSISTLPLKFIAFAMCVSLFACKKNGSPDVNPTSKSSVNIFLTDDQSLVFDHVFLNIIKVEIKVEDNDEQKHESEHQGEVDDNDKRGDASLGWMSVNIHPGVYDILKFRNGLDTLFATGSFASAKGLKKVRLTLGTNNSIVFNGTTSPLILKGNDNFVVIKIDESMVPVNSGGLTNFWIDIDAGRSIKKSGNDFELKPSVKVFSKEKAAGIEGRVLPANAAAIVLAINGKDTTSAKPESEGEFKFIGLKPGTYSLLYHATANNYHDITVNNIKVIEKEDNKVSTVTLLK
ncbi:MAG: DUF4382 domain-containing protein [Ferruginibacter sp.]